MGTNMMAEGSARTEGGLPRVVIVGAGFGGLSAVKALGNTNVDVLLLSRTPYHVFWMLLYQVAAAQLEAEAIATPVHAMLRRYRNVRFQVAEVCSIDFAQRLVHTAAEAIPYDYLILAAGCRPPRPPTCRGSATALSRCWPGSPGSPRVKPQPAVRPVPDAHLSTHAANCGWGAESQQSTLARLLLGSGERGRWIRKELKQCEHKVGRGY